MARYFTKARRSKAFWVEDETYDGPISQDTPQVCDHEAVDTGLLDGDGNTIWRTPNPMGFIWDED